MNNNLQGNLGNDDIGARSQGRPVRGANEIGRERLIEKTRELLKTRPKFDLQRREIAKFAGVTPALVTYHFPDKQRLFKEAIMSVIDEHVALLKATIDTKDPGLDELRALVELYVVFNVDHGSLLDNYVELIAGDQSDGSFDRLLNVQSTVQDFFARLIDRGLIKPGDPGILKSALWGACKYLGQTLNFRATLSAKESRQKIDASVDAIVDMFAIPSPREANPTGLRAP